MTKEERLVFISLVSIVLMGFISMYIIYINKI